MFILNRIFIKLADNQNRHEISDEFETGPLSTIYFEATYNSPVLTFLECWLLGERFGYLLSFQANLDNLLSSKIFCLILKLADFARYETNSSVCRDVETQLSILCGILKSNPAVWQTSSLYTNRNPGLFSVLCVRISYEFL